jgi:hypothetical protein
MQGHKASVASRRALFRDRPATMRFSSVWDLDQEKLTDDSSTCCGRSRSDVVIWSFLLLIGLGVGGYMAYLYVPRSANSNKPSAAETPKTESSTAIDINQNVTLDIAASNINTTNASTEIAETESSTAIVNNKNASVAAKINTTDTFNALSDIDLPPLDIEAMCSASNLPGSLPACLSACLPAACCYPDYTGPSCAGTPNCSLFKPHCDIFFDAWPESTEGVLRDVTNEMIEMCAGPDELVSKAHSSSATSQSIVVRNRLRGQSVI